MVYSQVNGSFLAFPGDVIAFAWSAPMRDLAKKIGISDVGLKKLLKAQGIATPPQGHWNRVHAGKVVASPPPPPDRKPGENGRVRLDGRFRGQVAEAGRMPVDGPFVSRHVPEDLAELRERELDAIGKAKAPRDLSQPHVGLSALLRDEESRREKCAGSRWHWDEPKFDTPLARRQLRILSGLFYALAKRGHTGHVYEREEQLRASCTIGDTTLELSFEVVGKHSTEQRRGHRLPARALSAKTPLRLRLDRALRAELVSSWEDREEPLEAGLAGIAADLVVAGEATFRRGLVEALEREREHREWLARSEREQRKRRNQERLAMLEESGMLLRKADEIRALVSRISSPAELARLGVDQTAAGRWKQWALARADEIDPIVSRQVLTHLYGIEQQD